MLLMSQSLETVEALGKKDDKPVSRDIARRILCLPVYASLNEYEQKKIIEIIQSMFAMRVE